MRGAEGLKAQDIALQAEYVGQSVAVHVGVMLGLIPAPEEVDDDGR